MKFQLSLPMAAAALVLLSGCAGTSLVNRDRPDEMAVTRQPPLVIPPDFALKPPAPGTAEGQQSNNTQQEALDAMFGGPAQRSQGETSMLDAAGRDAAEAGIRSAAGSQTNVIDKGKTVFDIVAAPAGDGQNARASVGQQQQQPTG